MLQRKIYKIRIQNQNNKTFLKLRDQYLKKYDLKSAKALVIKYAL